MEKNNLTLIIDGGWFMMSRFSALTNYLNKEELSRGEESRRNAEFEFTDLLWRSFFSYLNKLPMVDNIIMTMEGGSWRKNIAVPEQLGDITYKGNREDEDSEFDWEFIYGVFEKFAKKMKDLGIVVCRDWELEGDDWMMHWSKRLNENGVNCIILTSDGDIKQLVKYDEESGVFTAWWNEKNGLYLPENCKSCDDLLEMQLFQPLKPHNNTLEVLRGKFLDEHYINPDEVVMAKTISGDAGDNVKPCARVMKNGRNYGVGPKTCEKLLRGIGSPKSVDEFIRKFDLIACEIPRTIKQLSTCQSNDIREMLDYNLKMVWLDENILPPLCIEKMNKCEYKQVDVQELRLNGYDSVAPGYKELRTQVNIDELFS